MLGTQKGHTDLESLVLFIFAFSIPVHAGMSVGGRAQGLWPSES